MINTITGVKTAKTRPKHKPAMSAAGYPCADNARANTVRIKIEAKLAYKGEYFIQTRHQAAL